MLYNYCIKKNKNKSHKLLIAFILMNILFIFLVSFYSIYLFKNSSLGKKIKNIEHKKEFLLDINGILAKNKERLGDISEIKKYAENKLKMSFPETIQFIKVINGRIAKQ